MSWAFFDRFDIAEAHCVLEWDYNKGGWLQERRSNRRRLEATSIQLGRMQFRPAPDLGYDSLSENGQEIDLTNVLRMGLPRDEEQNLRIQAMFSTEWLARAYPAVHAELYPQ